MKAGEFGSQAEYHFDLDALRNLPLFGKYYLQIGVDHERFAFSRSNDIFPYAMSSVSAEIAISYWTGDVFSHCLSLNLGFILPGTMLREIRLIFRCGSQRESRLMTTFIWCWDWLRTRWRKPRFCR
jgi:hypothetical protein